ncbi:MAG: hypothetical protein GTN36_06175 [Candidatus Aenigmarchaeota archaeon]|nr:hypothetical protein [Candidatus Aenigmarchaeota archaeon]
MPKINSFSFGSLTIDSKKYEDDMVIHWDGEITPRESSHTFSKSELIDILLKGPETIIIGTGTGDCVKIDKAAEQFARSKNIEFIIKKTPEAVEEFNKLSRNKKVIAVIHVTC